MSDDTQMAPARPTQPARAAGHAPAPDPEAHLLEAHNLSVRVQGKEGPNGRAVWALVREEKGKVKTLSVFEGMRREAVARFYHYIHPEKIAAPAPSAPRRSFGGQSRGGSSRPSSRPGSGPSSRPNSGPSSRPSSGPSRP